MTDLHVYDTTLRDGAQQEGLNLSVTDKLAIARHLDDLGVGFIEGGWPGVLAQVSNMIALAEHRSADQRTARKANFIRLQARPGKAAALREFLIAGGDLVAQTEPQTLYWAALESEDRHDEFAIFDLFADQAGREAHFSGVVAAALADRAEELIIGGWQGVLAEVVHFDVHTGMSRN